MITTLFQRIKNISVLCCKLVGYAGHTRICYDNLYLPINDRKLDNNELLKRKKYIVKTARLK